MLKHEKTIAIVIIIGPLLTEFSVGRMAFGQSWPKT